MERTSVQIDPTFLSQLEYLDLEALDQVADVICFLDSGMHLRGFNEAWTRFALSNNGAAVLQNYPLGTDFFQGIPDNLRGYYQLAYERALQEGIAFEQNYECSSPTVFRKFRQTAYPLRDRAGLMITHHGIQESPHPDPPEQLDAGYFTPDGLIVQCSHCRKIQNQENPAHWVWIPELVRSPHPDTTHSLCIPCLEYYYPDLDD